MGEFVRHKNATWMVTGISNQLGFNTFHLVNIDSGVTTVTQRYLLETVPFVEFDLETVVEDDFELHQQTPSTQLLFAAL